MSAEEKRPYEEQAAADKVRYDKDMAAAEMVDVAEKEEGTKKAGEGGGGERKKDVKCKGGDSGAGSLDSAALIAAIEAGDVAAMARAVEGGASLMAGLDEYGTTALHLAALSRQLAVMQWLVVQGADINAKNSNGRTTFHSAAHNGQLAAIQRLAAQGADIHTKDRHGGTTLHAAACGGHVAVGARLVEQGLVEQGLPQGLPLATQCSDGSTGWKEATNEKARLAYAQSCLTPGWKEATSEKARITMAGRRKKHKMDQAMYWHRKRWADDKPAGTQIVIVQQIFATPEVDPSRLLEVQAGQYLYLLGYTADGWAQCQANELGIPTQIGFVPTQSLALFFEEEVARWSPVAPVVAALAPVASPVAAAAPVAAATAPSAGELKKLKAPELKEQLRKRGLPVSGKKEGLVVRLLAGWDRACCF
jgi:hypothetical protein